MEVLTSDRRPRRAAPDPGKSGAPACSSGAGGKRGSRFTCIVAIGILGLAPRLLAQGASPTEYQIKAAFLYNFARFVEWPASALPDSARALILGILGEDPFGPEIDRIVEGKTVNGRRLEIRRLKDTDSLNGCHILFVSTSEGRRLPRILEALRLLPVLTVGDFESFAGRGGIIDFVLEENRIRFEINQEAAERAGLKISSKLLKLATLVREPGRP